MYYTVSVSGDDKNKYALHRVALQIDPYTTELLQYTDKSTGMGFNNCGSKVIVTKYIVFVGCASRGVIDMFVTNDLDVLSHIYPTLTTSTFSD
jgi:hypothetical protein